MIMSHATYSPLLHPRRTLVMVNAACALHFDASLLQRQSRWRVVKRKDYSDDLAHSFTFFTSQVSCTQRSGQRRHCAINQCTGGCFLSRQWLWQNITPRYTTVYNGVIPLTVGKERVKPRIYPTAVFTTPA